MSREGQSKVKARLRQCTCATHARWYVLVLYCVKYLNNLIAIMKLTKVKEKVHLIRLVWTTGWCRKRGQTSSSRRETPPIQKVVVTTPTQPQLNSKVGFDTKMTLDHPPHKLNVINIQLFLTRFNSNFKGRFVGSTKATFYLLLTQFWPNFDSSFWDKTITKTTTSSSSSTTTTTTKQEQQQQKIYLSYYWPNFD